MYCTRFNGLLKNKDDHDQMDTAFSPLLITSLQVWRESNREYKFGESQTVNIRCQKEKEKKGVG
jgi:hypothetical protein